MVHILVVYYAQVAVITLWFYTAVFKGFPYGTTRLIYMHTVIKAALPYQRLHFPEIMRYFYRLYIHHTKIFYSRVEAPYYQTPAVCAAQYFPYRYTRSLV